MKLLHFFFLFLFTFASCITSYRDYPRIESTSKPAGVSKNKLYYHLTPFPILEFGGYAALKSYFKNNISQNFSDSEEIIDPKVMPPKGMYCKVTTQWAPVSAPALIFGYISIATATFLPAWSRNDGYDVTYTLYKDGQKIKEFNYSTRRSVFLWMFALPVIWVNVFTSSEEEVFKAMSAQFVEDAKPYFNQ